MWWIGALCVVCLLGGWSAGGAVQVVSGADGEVRYDQSEVTVRSVDPVRLTDYRQDPDFDYDVAPDPGAPWWVRLWRWFVRTVVAPIFGAVPGTVYRWLLYGLLAVVLVYTVMRLLRLDLRGVFTRRSGHQPVLFTMTEDDLERIDLDRRIAEAERRGDLRQAVRWQYLRILQHLAAADLITWAIDKTNHEYLRQLPPGALREAFDDLTVRFEYAWYADQPVQPKDYQGSRADFERFVQEINRLSGTADDVARPIAAST